MHELVPVDRTLIPVHNKTVIQSFANNETKKLFQNKRVKRFDGIERMARRKLLIIHAALNLNDLRVPPGNRLESLKGNRAGQHSIRINNQWRICFVWQEGAAHKVEIVDYH